MKVCDRDMQPMMGDEYSVAGVQAGAGRPSSVTRRLTGFTLIELLVVIAILGIIAGLAVPALKNIGKSNVAVSASRQLLDDVGRARQLALNNHTTVYMVFIPPGFWDSSPSVFNSAWFGSLNPFAQTAVTNLADKQLTGYTFVTLRSVGDQPGRGTPQYLAPWQSLPAGTFIAQQKFIPQNQSFFISQWDNTTPIYGFATNSPPFPTETNTSLVTTNLPSLPYIAFNYLGQLTFDGQNIANRDEYIPLAQGSVSPAIDPVTRTFQITATGLPSVLETPTGNSTNSYNIVHIDRLTGRAVLEFQKVQ